jgi:hypothetical protein
MHPFVEGLLDLGVAHEHQAAVLEVKVFEGAEVLFKPSCCLESSLVDFGVEGIDVGRTFFVGRWRGEIRDLSLTLQS